MGKHLYWLDDAGWSAIEPLLPRGRRGARRVDDRRVIWGIMPMLKTGARWRDCPAGVPPPVVAISRQWRAPCSPRPNTPNTYPEYIPRIQGLIG